MPDIKKYPDITKKEFVTKFIEEFGAKSMLNPGAILKKSILGYQTSKVALTYYLKQVIIKIL